MLRADFWKANVFRIILLLYMLAVGGCMTARIAVGLTELFTDFRFDTLSFSILGISVLLLCNNIFPIVFVVNSIRANKDTVFLPYSAGEIVGQILLTLLKMALYAVFSGFLFSDLLFFLLENLLR